MGDTLRITKQYVNTAVQTISPELLGRCATCGFGSVLHPATELDFNHMVVRGKHSEYPSENQSIVASRAIAAGHLVEGKCYLPRLAPSRESLVLAHKARVVSLSDDLISENSLDKLAVDASASRRCVSLPSSYLKVLTPPSSHAENTYIHPTPLSNNDIEQTCILAPSGSPDLPQTPSPPSTPESVEIIDTSVHFPNSFLRQDTKLSKEENNDGWLSWASSPPRPIPALHGPASLPYARCPSGAEGTVIEENTNVPGLIWGLGEDGHSQRIRQANTKHTVPTLSSVPYTARDGKPQIDTPDNRRIEIAESHASHLRQCADVYSFAQINKDTTQTPANRTPREIKSPVQNLFSVGSNSCGETYVFHEDLVGHENYPVQDQVRPKLSSQQTRGGRMRAIQDATDPCNSSNIQPQPNLNAYAPSFVPNHIPQPNTMAHLHGVQLGDGKLAALQLQSEIQLARIQAQLAVYQSILGSEASESLLTPPSTVTQSWASRFSPLHPYLDGLSVPTYANAALDDSSTLARLYAQARDNFPRHDGESSDDSYPPTPIDTSYAFPQVSIAAPRIPKPFRDPSLPEMPIHLQDLVPHHTPKMISIMSSPGPHTSVLFATQNTSKPTRLSQSTANVKQVDKSALSSKEEVDKRKPAFGRRLPRSIPLAKLVNRRLASVPEESSMTNCDDSKDVSSRSLDELTSTKMLKMAQSCGYSSTDSSYEDISALVNSSQSSIEDHSASVSIEDIKVKLPSGKGSERGEATSRKDADMREPERRWKSRNTGSTALNSPTKATGKWRRKKD